MYLLLPTRLLLSGLLLVGSLLYAMIAWLFFKILSTAESFLLKDLAVVSKVYFDGESALQPLGRWF